MPAFVPFLTHGGGGGGGGGGGEGGEGKKGERWSALHEVSCRFIPQNRTLQKNRMHHSIQTEHTFKSTAAGDGPRSGKLSSSKRIIGFGVGAFSPRRGCIRYRYQHRAILQEPGGVKGTIHKTVALDIDVTEKFSLWQM